MSKPWRSLAEPRLALLFSAQQIISALGPAAVIGVAVLIFLETATVFGSVLPGDSLLFLLGLSLGTGIVSFNFPLALLLLWIGATGGSWVSYWFGIKVGRDYFTSRDGWLINPKNVARTESFFARYGIRAILIARFIPVLRALVPMFAGLAALDHGRFWRVNLLSALAWAVGVTCLGAALGNVPWVRENFEFCVLAFVILSSLPLPIELLRHAIRERKTRS